MTATEINVVATATATTRDQRLTISSVVYTILRSSLGNSRNGTNSPQAFSQLWIIAGYFSRQRAAKAAKEWLLIEWPEGEDEPTRYWLSTLPQNTSFRNLVDAAKLRWRIERDYEELKQEVGLGHFEGRGWRGFHHHATLCIAAYGFLISERETIPPSGPRSAGLFPKLAVPDGYRPRGSSLAA